jgi:hypothetical protein
MTPKKHQNPPRQILDVIAPWLASREYNVFWWGHKVLRSSNSMSLVCETCKTSLLCWFHQLLVTFLSRHSNIWPLHHPEVSNEALLHPQSFTHHSLRSCMVGFRPCHTLVSFRGLFIYLFIGGIVVCTQSFSLQKLALYCLSHFSRPCCSGYFREML